MRDDEITKSGEDGDCPGHGINRRQFLKAGAILGGGILGGGVFNFAFAFELEHRDATGGIRILGCNSDASTGVCFDNSLPPVFRIKSGDTVAIETGTHLMDGMVPGVRTEDWIGMYTDEMAKYPDTYFSPDPATKVEKHPNHTHLTGPIYVEGAEPGDILQIEILETISEDFMKGRVKWYRADLNTNEFGSLPSGKVPLSGKHARHLDCKEWIAGTALFFPVWVKGAGVVTGDFLLAQGDGEVEMRASAGASRNITLRMTVRKDLKGLGNWPFLSTPTHWIALGIHTDPDEACKMVVRKSLRFLKTHHGMSDGEGYAFCSMGVDRQVTRYVKRHAIMTHIRG
jgi:acetamidase/formamidase